MTTDFGSVVLLLFNPLGRFPGPSKTVVVLLAVLVLNAPRGNKQVCFFLDLNALQGAAGTRWLSEGKVDTKLRQRPSNWRIVTNVCWEPIRKNVIWTRIVCETFVLQQRP